MKKHILTENEKRDLHATVVQSISDLRKYTEIGQIKAEAFNLKFAKEEFQVQIIVTRYKPDFLDFLQTEATTIMTAEEHMEKQEGKKLFSETLKEQNILSI